LPDIAALAERDAIQFRGVAFEPEQVAEFGHPFTDSVRKAMRKPLLINAFPI
jgi:hypothetical protein